MSSIVIQRVPPMSLRSGRTLEERAIVRYPRTHRGLLRFADVVPPRARLRRAMVLRRTHSSLSALARGDLELWLAPYSRDAVHEWSSGLVSLGFPEHAEGHAGLFKAMAEWDEAWERWSVTQHFVLDLGTTIVCMNKIAGRTANAGLEVDLDHVAINHMRAGLVTRERDYNDWPAGLDAAGLDPALLPRLEAMAPGATLVLRT